MELYRLFQLADEHLHVLPACRFTHTRSQKDTFFHPAAAKRSDDGTCHAWQHMED